MPRLYLLALALFIVVGCDSTDAAQPADDAVVFEIAVNQETFRIALSSSTVIATAQQALDTERIGGIIGDLAEGDGGFNAPYTWHMVPETVEFVDIAIEVCDGRPLSDVEGNTAYWVGTVGNYCPWTAKVVRRVE